MSGARYVDLEVREFLLRFETTKKDGIVCLKVFEKEKVEDGEPLAADPLRFDDLQSIARGGTVQTNGIEGYLLARHTVEGV